MAGVNKVVLVGNLGKDPEVRYTGGGQAVANFSIATSESWTDKAGQKQEKTEWHRIVVWGKLAELCGEYLQKGRQAYIEGKLQTREWTDKENVKHYSTEVVARDVVFLGGGQGQQQRPASSSSSSEDFGPPPPGFDDWSGETPSTAVKPAERSRGDGSQMAAHGGPASQGQRSSGGAVFPNYGQAKNQPIAGASPQDLEYYAIGCRRTLNDPAKSKWHDKEKQLLAAIEAELAGGGAAPARGGGAGPGDDDIPF